MGLVAPGRDRTTLIAEGAGWLAWRRNATGERVVGLRHDDKLSCVELGGASKLRAAFPGRQDDIDAALQAMGA